MRLSCPSCQTEYDVPDAALAGRTRTLRCVTCGYQWQAGPLPGDAPIPPPPAPSPKPAEPAMAAELDDLNRPRAAETPPKNPDPPRQLPPHPEPLRQSDPRSEAAEARSQADRETFAALLESSRKNGTFDSDPKFRRQQASRNPWLISILILLLAIALTWLERGAIMHAWPPSIRLFHAIASVFAHK
jgi:predicted Zn finger-like uncharacterized protein